MMLTGIHLGTVQINGHFAVLALSRFIAILTSINITFFTILK